MDQPVFLSSLTFFAFEIFCLSQFYGSDNSLLTSYTFKDSDGVGYSSTALVLEYYSSTTFGVLVLATPGTRLVLVLEGQCARYSVKKSGVHKYIWLSLEVTN